MRLPHPLAFLVSSGHGCYLDVIPCLPEFSVGHDISCPYNAIVPPTRRSRTGKHVTRRRLARQPDIRPYRGKHPQIAASAYIDPAAVIIGPVVIGEDCGVWPCAVIRGDVHYIRIVARTNIQDGSVLHVMRDELPLILGDDATIGHSVTLHGCTIESRCLIGMGAVILNGVTVGAGSIVAAGTLITERTVIPAGSLVMGSPGKEIGRASCRERV